MELLVSIGVIVTLAAFRFPAIHQARERGLQAFGMGSQRQLGVALAKPGVFRCPAAIAGMIWESNKLSYGYNDNFN